VLSRYGPVALQALARLGRGAYEGAEAIILGGIVLIWRAGQWVIKGVVEETAKLAVGADKKRQAIRNGILSGLGYFQGAETPPGGPPFVPNKWYVYGWAAGTVKAACEPYLND
jgi:hypothetical protein